MRTNFYLMEYGSSRYKKVTKKVAMTLISEQQLEDAKYTFMRDPNISNEYMTMAGRLLIRFEY